MYLVRAQSAHCSLCFGVPPHHPSPPPGPAPTCASPIVKNSTFPSRASPNVIPPEKPFMFSHTPNSCLPALCSYRNAYVPLRWLPPYLLPSNLPQDVANSFLKMHHTSLNLISYAFFHSCLVNICLTIPICTQNLVTHTPHQ